VLYWVLGCVNWRKQLYLYQDTTLVVPEGDVTPPAAFSRRVAYPQGLEAFELIRALAAARLKACADTVVWRREFLQLSTSCP